MSIAKRYRPTAVLDVDNKEILTPVARREAYLRQRCQVSQRRACRAIGVDRTVVGYRGTRPDDHALRVRLRELVASRWRFGYRLRIPSWTGEAAT